MSSHMGIEGSAQATERLSSEIEALAESASRGEVLLFPTDTVLGLGASPSVPGAAERIFALKHRPADRHLPVMVGGVDALHALGVDLGPAEAALAEAAWPGGVTLVLPVGHPDRRPDWLDGRDEFAVRVPDVGWLRSLLDRTGPLLVTSANRSGADDPPDTIAALAQLDGVPGAVVHGERAGPGGSTIVNLTCFPPRIEREGPVAGDSLLAVWQDARPEEA